MNKKVQFWSEKILDKYQCGFSPEKATIDHIFSIRQMLEKIYLIHLFIDFKQTYDSINKEELLKTMIKLGITKKTSQFIKNDPK